KLRHLDRENARRREIARVYDSRLGSQPVILPRSRGAVEHVYHQYVIRSQQREGLRAFLKDNGIGTAIHYPTPVHLQPAYRSRIAIADGGLEETERACGEILSLPMYPQMTNEQAASVCEAIARWRDR